MANRRSPTLRDMSLSMGVLLAVVLVITGVTMGFTFSPGRPSVGPAPTADVITGFEQAHRVVKFTVAVPADLPANWHPSSLTLTNPATAPAGSLATVRGGWITPNGSYITLIEAAGTPTQVLDAEIGVAGQVTGTVQPGRDTWSVAPGKRKEVAWYRSVGPVTYLITGDAPAESFAVLATSIEKS